MINGNRLAAAFQQKKIHKTLNWLTQINKQISRFLPKNKWIWFNYTCLAVDLWYNEFTTAHSIRAAALMDFIKHYCIVTKLENFSNQFLPNQMPNVLMAAMIIMKSTLRESMWNVCTSVWHDVVHFCFLRSHTIEITNMVHTQTHPLSEKQCKQVVSWSCKLTLWYLVAAEQ